MIFIVDSTNKIIFGWSPKCGCSIVKTIAWYLIEGCSNPEIHTYKDIMDLPEDMENYTVIMVCRDPFKRIVSGFLDKYNKQGIYRCMWGTDEPITFRKFVNEVINQNWSKIDFHHFVPQMGDKMDESKIARAKHVVTYDITQIDYDYIGSLYNKKISEEIIQRNKNARPKMSQTYINENIYDVNIDDYFAYDVEFESFYNPEIQQKVYDFYKKDFDTFYPSYDSL